MSLTPLMCTYYIQVSIQKKKDLTLPQETLRVIEQHNSREQRNAATFWPFWGTTEITHQQSSFCLVKVKKLNTPGVKKCPIEEAAVVVVAHKVAGDGLPGAGLGHDLIGHCDPIFGVVEVQEHHVKHQRRLSRDVAAWGQRHQRGWRPAGGLLNC